MEDDCACKAAAAYTCSTNGKRRRILRLELGDKRISVTIELTPEAEESFAALAKEEGLSLSDYLSRMLSAKGASQADLAPAERARLWRESYEGLATLLKDHGLSETRDSVAAKLKRGTFAATFLLACLAALGLEEFRLKEL